ncbi:hypothetical protein [Dyella amyloliquefaciens]|uniref:hypothetical protein n=1 Tax=Dyella amyloliquefaciens TaxID=1770545 RepID=UPI00102E44C5|nr:hypothetical protein [Dyella amyloliquefaciens]
MKKLILLAILAGLAWWYFDHGRRITEADVRASYEADMDATRRFDGDFLCARISDDFAGSEVSRQDGEDFEEHFDKAGQCKRIKRSIEAMQQLSVATGGRISLKIDYEIKNIEFSPDRKRATVQTVSTAKLGDMTLARDRTTDHLIRRNGRILSIASEARVWTYTPQ